MKKTVPILLGLFSLISEARWNTTNPYGTHQPVLHAMAIKTKGAIIEFGCGNYSTDMLHEICKKTNRVLISIEDDLEWLNKFKQKYIGDGYEPDNSGWHKFYYVPGRTDDANPNHWIAFLDQFELLKTLDIELCFIDQSPWLARHETLKRVRNKVRYVIVHDCDYFPEHGIFGKTIRSIVHNSIPGVFDFSDVFAHFKVYFPPHPWAGHTGPPTLLGSNFDNDLPEIDFEAFEG